MQGALRVGIWSNNNSQLKHNSAHILELEPMFYLLVFDGDQKIKQISTYLKPIYLYFIANLIKCAEYVKILFNSIIHRIK